MKDWYLKREGAGNEVFHRSTPIPANKKILLTEEQAKTHNVVSEVVVKTKPPEKPEEAAIFAEYREWQEAKTASSETETRRKSSK